MGFILKNWIILTIGLVLTAAFVRIAYLERGYIAVGGEWLIVPLLIGAKILFKSVMEEIRE